MLLYRLTRYTVLCVLIALSAFTAFAQETPVVVPSEGIVVTDAAETEQIAEADSQNLATFMLVMGVAVILTVGAITLVNERNTRLASS